MSNKINNVYQSEKINKIEIFTEFENFVQEINEKVKRFYRGIEGLIDEPGENNSQFRFCTEKRFSDQKFKKR